jgi:tetratricopeptide (TPR) repeat protein
VSNTDNFEILKSFPKKTDIGPFLEMLEKNRIKFNIRQNAESEEQEVWVSSASVFTALGLTAEFDQNKLKQKSEKQSEDYVMRKIEQERKTRINISILAGILLLILSVAFIRLMSLRTDIDTISKEVSGSKINISSKSLKEDFNILAGKSGELKSKKLSVKTIRLRWLLNSAQKALSNDDFDKALQKLSKCRKLAPANKAIISLLASTYIKSGKQSEAIRILKESYSISPEDHDWQKWIAINIADIFINDKDYPAARYELNKILETEASDKDIITKLVSVYAMESEYELARQMLEMLIQTSPDDPKLFLQKCEYMIKSAHYAVTRDSLLDFIKTEKEKTLRAAALQLLSLSSVFLDDIEKASEYIMSEGLNAKQDSRTELIKAMLLYHSGDFAASEDLFNSSMELSDKGITAALYNFIINARYLDSTGLDSSLEQILRLESRCDGKYETSLLNFTLGLISYKMGAEQIAYEYFTAAVKDDPHIIKRFSSDPFIPDDISEQLK